MVNRLVCGIAVLAALILGPSLALGQDGTVSPSKVAAPRPSAAATFTKTIAGDLKSMISADNVPVMSSAAALALLALPFDETLTFSASCSTFLKTSFDGWARIVGQEWFLAAGAAGTYAFGRFAGSSAFGILAGRSATLNLASRRVHLSPAPMPGGFMITGSIQ